MTYQQTLDYIYTRLPMFSNVGVAAMKGGFDNIRALCSFLGNPQYQTKFIHIAGTNGKGSVSHMLASILQTQGYKTGLYTSPHLKDFRERVKINGKMITEAEVVAFIDRVAPEIERINPSFFEITVALAFDHFARNQVAYAVIETGLGGRLDSTNIICPEIAVITNISFDHMQLLGDTLVKIAGEKAGIIKQEVPVVIGEFNDETAPVFIEKAAACKAPISFADKEFHVENWFYDAEDLFVEVSKNDWVDHLKYRLDLNGAYQAKNLLTVLEACRQLNRSGLFLSETNIANGIAHTKRLSGLHGRWETLQRKPRVILDVAHNEDGIKQVLNQLEVISFRKLHLILGFVKDKAIDKMLNLLPATANYYFTNAHLPRALSCADLQAKASLYGLIGNIFPDVNQALAGAKAAAHDDDLIIICGSIFLVGEVV